MCVRAASMLCSWPLGLLGVDSGNFQSLPIASAPVHPLKPQWLHKCISMYLRNGFADIVELLLAFQADTESTETAFHRTCLHIAASRGFLDVARLLLKAKADKDRTDKNGNSALALAAAEGQAEVVSLLLRTIPTWKDRHHSSALACKAKMMLQACCFMQVPTERKVILQETRR